jgi:6-phosphogluconate dehydrogenase (decarboxylating)
MNPADWEKMRVQGLLSIGAPWESLAEQLKQRGIALLGFDPDALSREEMLRRGIHATSSVQAVILHLPRPKVVWLIGADEKSFLPASRLLAELLEPGSLVLDGSGRDWGQQPQITKGFEAAGIQYLSPGKTANLLATGFL